VVAVRVFLIHGMGRSRLSMMPLARYLQRQGHAPSLFGYSVARRTLGTIADDFVAHVTATRAAGAGGPYAIVGHSLGNIVTRLSSDRLPEGFERFVMLAPPNRSPALARAFHRQPVYRLLTGDAGQRLADANFYAELPWPRTPSLIIAGDAGTGRLAYRGPAANDGVVSVDETRLDGVAHRVIPALHTLIMNHAAARQLIVQFLAHGQLD
jgi:pimeloyl-ACP methyl ester carboxylesterase